MNFIHIIGICYSTGSTSSLSIVVEVKGYAIDYKCFLPFQCWEFKPCRLSVCSYQSVFFLTFYFIFLSEMVCIPFFPHERSKVYLIMNLQHHHQHSKSGIGCPKITSKGDKCDKNTNLTENLETTLVLLLETSNFIPGMDAQTGVNFLPNW